ncbi:hypothetical protein WT37_26560 [Burkholderia territorii]|nr:hypothetical protein WT37_26560 [Burkholderia territorii]
MAFLLLAVTAGAHAESGTSADELLDQASSVLQRIDADQEQSVWTSTAAFVRSRVSQEQFTVAMKLARRGFGAVAHRGWASVSRIRYAGASGIPDGLYANVDMATTLSDGGMVFELLSFRLEDDGHWHLTGYQSRQSQTGAELTKVVTP